MTFRDDVVGDEERVDLAWEETEARRREDLFDRDRKQHDAEFREQWARMARRDRLTWVEEQLTAMSTVSAASLERSRSSGPASGPPPGAFDPSAVSPVELDSDLWVIDSRLERLRDKIREAQGLTAARSTVRMLSEEKDAEILKLEGVSAAAISSAKPWLGSPETIRRVRRNNAKDSMGHDRDA